MPRGDKSTYTAKQKRQAKRIEEGYEKRGVPEKEAARRAWATENKISGGGRKGGSGRPVSQEDHSPMKKGGEKGGRAAARRPAKARSASAKHPKGITNASGKGAKAAATRKRRGT